MREGPVSEDKPRSDRPAGGRNGTLRVVGALYGLRAYIDRALLGAPEVTMPAGDASAAIRMRGSEFERLVDARPGDFSIPQSVVAVGGAAQVRRGGDRSPSRPATRRRP